MSRTGEAGIDVLIRLRSSTSETREAPVVRCAGGVRQPLHKLAASAPTVAAAFEQTGWAPSPKRPTTRYRRTDKLGSSAGMLENRSHHGQERDGWSESFAGPDKIS
jgi:hypothetical protein